MDKIDKKKYEYSAISIKADVAIRFRRYSKQFAKSHSEVLHRMIFFLQWNRLDPFGRSVDKIVSALEKERKQIEYLISIIKNIEKTQTKPTYEMVKILFEAYCKNNKTAKKEKAYARQPKLVEVKETIAKVAYDQLYREFKDYQNNCRQLLGKIKLVEPTFGKPYLRADLSQEEYERFRRALEKD